MDAGTLGVQYNYDTAAHNARLTSVVYPNGRRVHYTYGSSGSASDLLDRLEAIQEDDGSGNPGTVLARYKYLGADTVVEEDYAEPDVQLDYASNNYSGFDRLGRVVDQLWETYSGTAVDEYRYTYDRAGNRTTRENVVAGSQYKNLDELYSYDSLDQLTAIERGDLNAARDAILSGTESFSQDWTLDALGNWLDFDDDGSSQTRASNAANEITSVTGGPVTPTYDAAGNMISIAKPSDSSTAYTLTYDAWNRLIAVYNGGSLVAQYQYDGTGRRISKQTGSTTVHYFHDGQQVIETREGTSGPSPESLSPAYQFVWSPRYVDALILRDTYVTVKESPSLLGGDTTGGPLPLAAGLSITGFFFPLLQPMLRMLCQPTIRQ